MSAKRVLDAAIAAALLPAVGLLGLVAALAIRLESKGPALFRQVRVGQHEAEFILYKFRTMAIDTTDVPTHEVSHTKVTRVGRFFRRTKVDELPQVWNVLKGDMSFVGPRPCLPSQVELIYERRVLGVAALKPGITGPAQLRGIDMSTPRALAEADAEYLRLQSTAFDLRCVISTLLGSGSGDRVPSAE